jgi:hypothetical protein
LPSENPFVHLPTVASGALTQVLAGLQIDEMQPGARRAGYRLVFGIGRIFVVIIEGVLDLQAGFGQVKMNAAILRKPRAIAIARSAKRKQFLFRMASNRRTGSPPKKRSGQLRPLQVV